MPFRSLRGKTSEVFKNLGSLRNFERGDRFLSGSQQNWAMNLHLLGVDSQPVE
jgi:hypothetical protein